MSLGMLAACISIAGEIPYLRAILRGKTRPERSSWGIWSFILLIALISYEASGAGDSVWFVIGELVATSLVFACSLFRGTGGFERRNLACIGIALLGVGVWQLTDQSVIALIGVIIADLAGVYPTALSALKNPCGENATTFAASSLASALGFIAVGQWSIELLVYPAYLFLANVALVFIILVGQYHAGRIPASCSTVQG